MNNMTASNRKSAFNKEGFKTAIEELKKEIQDLYTSDDVPWIIGYSGGKDSTATLQLVWLALRDLPKSKLTKTVHVISTDTLVENPIVAAWVENSLTTMLDSAKGQKLPIQPHRLTPRYDDSFWVNLIGKGYPAPRHKFRWCTARLKISPSNTFITEIIKNTGHALLLLGTRKAESASRAANMTRHEKGRWRERISPNSSLPGSLVYTPIEDWSNDDVWYFLMQEKNPWGFNNKELLSMYAGATEGGECPLVIDTSTPSCGDSRFGCWVCTLVERDKSMAAMVQNDQEKEWMRPLLALRDQLDFRGKGTGDIANSDRHLRDFRRISGNVQIFHDKTIPGPYTQDSRAMWLRKLLEAQTWIRKNGPEGFLKIELITLPELEEIRRIWVLEKHELEDALPRIYEEATGEKYPGQALDDALVLGADDMQELETLCAGDRLHYELTRELLSVERQERSQGRRAKLYEKLEKSFGKHFFDNEADATQYAQKRVARRKVAEDGPADESYGAERGQP